MQLIVHWMNLLSETMRNIVKFALLATFTGILVTQICQATNAQSIQAQSGLAILSEMIDEEVISAKSELDKNTVSTKKEIQDLKDKVDSIWSEIKTKGYAERKGLDSEWRGAFVTLQAIIESSLAQALRASKITYSEAFIIAPRMPTPLMLVTGTPFSKIKTSEAMAFAELRHEILKDYFESGGKLNAVYSYDSVKILSDDIGMKVYKDLVTKYPNNLKDSPLINISMVDFPKNKTTALYYINFDTAQAISIQSYQVTQLEHTSTNESSWAIRFGKSAQARVKEINTFFSENDANSLVR